MSDGRNLLDKFTLVWYYNYTRVFVFFWKEWGVMENKIIEDFVVFVEKLHKETNIHPARIEYIIKNFLEHCPTGSH